MIDVRCHIEHTECQSRYSGINENMINDHFWQADPGITALVYTK